MFPPFVKLGLEIVRDMDASASMTNDGKALCNSGAQRGDTTAGESTIIATMIAANLRRIRAMKMEDFNGPPVRTMSVS